MEKMHIKISTESTKYTFCNEKKSQYSKLWKSIVWFE